MSLNLNERFVVVAYNYAGSSNPFYYRGRNDSGEHRFGETNDKYTELYHTIRMVETTIETLERECNPEKDPNIKFDYKKITVKSSIHHTF